MKIKTNAAQPQEIITTANSSRREYARTPRSSAFTPANHRLLKARLQAHYELHSTVQAPLMVLVMHKIVRKRSLFCIPNPRVENIWGLEKPAHLARVHLPASDG